MQYANVMIVSGGIVGASAAHFLSTGRPPFGRNVI